MISLIDGQKKIIKISAINLIDPDDTSLNNIKESLEKKSQPLKIRCIFEESDPDTMQIE